MAISILFIISAILFIRLLIILFAKDETLTFSGRWVFSIISVVVLMSGLRMLELI